MLGNNENRKWNTQTVVIQRALKASVRFDTLKNTKLPKN